MAIEIGDLNFGDRAHALQLNEVDLEYFDLIQNKTGEAIFKGNTVT